MGPGAGIEVSSDVTFKQLAWLCAAWQDDGRLNHPLADFNGPVDWKGLVRLAERHSVVPTLYNGVQAVSAGGVQVPPEYVAYLRSVSRKVLLANVQIEAEMLRVLASFDKEGIPCLAFKGPVLAREAFGNIGFRPFSDFDILIDFNDFNCVKHIMTITGYEPILEYNAVGEKKIFRFEKEYTFVKEEKGRQRYEADIHWALLSKFLGLKVSLKDLAPHTVSREINNQTLRVLTPEYRLIVLCLHHGGSDGWLKLKHVLDFHMAVGQVKTDEAWKFILEECDRLGIERMMHIALHLSGKIFHTRYPEWVDKQLADDRKAKTVAHSIEWARKPEEFTGLALLKRQLKMRDNPWVRLQIVRRSIAAWFAPNSADQDFFPLPAAGKMYLFYYFVKPFRLLFRGENKDKFQ